ncbi:MAG: GTP-binding protein [Urechidicola sp.]|jgi:GTP-binding protein
MRIRNFWVRIYIIHQLPIQLEYNDCLMSNLFQQAQYLTSAFELSQILPDEGKEVAFAGRSNSGKSSAINCLTHQKKLCKTSKTPGRTQLINFFGIEEGSRLVDLPGYGFAKVPTKLREHWGTVLSTFLLERKALAGLVIVVDIRRGISDIDQALIDLAGHQIDLHILLTKSDKLSKAAISKTIFSVKKSLGDERHSVSSLSILNRQGLEELEKKCAEWLALI